MQSQIETQGEKESGRLEAFSDGVFAIAITLLVLELKAPSIPPGGETSAALGKALLQLWLSCVALVGSFFTVLIMWMRHHAKMAGGFYAGTLSWWRSRFRSLPMQPSARSCCPATLRISLSRQLCAITALARLSNCWRLSLR